MPEVTEEAFDESPREPEGRDVPRAGGRAPSDRRRRGGRHVHLLSVRAKLGMRDRGYSAYCSTKGGLVMLVRQHAVELARHGITVNGVAPTFVYTETMTKPMTVASR